MCVVTQVLDRVARELREDAQRLEEEAKRDLGTAPITLRIMRQVATSLRDKAKQLDGKQGARP